MRLLSHGSTLSAVHHLLTYFQMEIPARGVINRYIAAQGPLEKTCGDFWQVKHEFKRIRLIILLLPFNFTCFIVDGLGTGGVPCYHANYNS